MWCLWLPSRLVQGLLTAVLIESKAEGSISWSKLAPTGVLSPQGYPGVLCNALVFRDVYYWPDWCCFSCKFGDFVCMQMIVKTSRVIQRPCDHESFQDDLNDLVPWSGLNHMSFNTKQCKLKRISKNRSPILLAPLQLDGTTLQVTAEFSDLGLLITNHKLNCPGTLT